MEINKLVITDERPVSLWLSLLARRFTWSGKKNSSNYHSSVGIVIINLHYYLNNLKYLLRVIYVNNNICSVIIKNLIFNDDFYCYRPAVVDEDYREPYNIWRETLGRRDKREQNNADQNEYNG